MLQHRLGRLPAPFPSPPIHRLLRARGNAVRAALDLLSAGRQAARDAPDLLEQLPLGGFDRLWAGAVEAEVEERHDRGEPLRLLRCEHAPGEDGHVAIALLAPDRQQHVREGDLLVGGVAVVRGPDQRLRAWPRIYRKVCDNGAVVYAHSAADTVVDAGTVRDAVRACLAPDTTGTAFARLRQAARTRVADPLALLARADLPLAPETVMAAREEDDDTVFGVLNALTAFAREVPDFPRRVALERGAEYVLRAAGIAVEPSRSPRATMPHGGSHDALSGRRERAATPART